MSLNELSNAEIYQTLSTQVEVLLDSLYGTDPRHSLAADALAKKFVYGVPIPWSLTHQFGRNSAGT